jgi:hypothetical protein
MTNTLTQCLIVHKQLVLFSFGKAFDPLDTGPLLVAVAVGPGLGDMITLIPIEFRSKDNRSNVLVS